MLALEWVAPDHVGLSEAGIRRIRDVLRAELASAGAAGAVLGVALRGRAAILEPVVADPETRAAPSVDQAFWIASMTKPVVAVAALALVERGALALDDEVTQHLPELDLSRVAPGGDLSMPLVRAHPVTILDLMQHTSGLVEGHLGTTDVHAAFAEAVGDGMTSFSGDEFLARLSGVPLFDQPGTVWHYGWGFDVLGLLLERITGATLGELLRALVLEPLAMTGTWFGRHARPGASPSGAADLARARFDSGGAGLVSTAEDYLRFAAMLLGHGSLDGTHVIGRRLASLMLSDRLPPSADTSRLTASTMAGPGYGFGLGVAVRRWVDPPDVGSVGEFTWPGAGGTDWWGDPREDLAVVLMASTPGAETRSRIARRLRAQVHQAIPRT